MNQIFEAQHPRNPRGEFTNKNVAESSGVVLETPASSSVNRDEVIANVKQEAAEGVYLSLGDEAFDDYFGSPLTLLPEDCSRDTVMFHLQRRDDGLRETITIQNNDMLRGAWNKLNNLLETLPPPSTMPTRLNGSDVTLGEALTQIAPGLADDPTFLRSCQVEALEFAPPSGPVWVSMDDVCRSLDDVQVMPNGWKTPTYYDEHPSERPGPPVGSCDTAIVAKTARKELKAAIEAGYIPRPSKTSMRTARFAGGSSIDTELAYPDGHPIFEVNDENTYRDNQIRHWVQRSTDHLVRQWNISRSDSMTDYFDETYYGRAQIVHASE